MERLTQKIFGDKVKLPLIPQVTDRATLAEFHDVRRWYEECVISLAEYENTKLTPEEIMALQEKVKYAEFCAKSCLEYKQEIGTLKKALELAVEDMNHIANKIANCKEFLSGGTDKVNALKLGRCDVCKGICHDDKPCRFEWRVIQQVQEQEGKK